MKKYIGILTAIAISVTISAQAQRPHGGMGGSGPDFSGAMSKYFGDNKNFSSDLELQSKDMQGADISIPGKIAFSEGTARFEMNMSDMKSNGKPAPAAAQMKAMGMESVITITHPDKKISTMIYPGMKAYCDMPTPGVQADDIKTTDDFNIELTEIGKETVDGHPCIKNKAVVTDKKGNKTEATIWNATDLKKFPVKIDQTQDNQHVTMLFKNINLSKPDAKLFDAPSDYKKYASMAEMMQEIMMKRVGKGRDIPTPPAPGQ